MFSFFKKRKTIVAATPHMRRVIDLSTPNYMRTQESRGDRRYMRALPAAIFPWRNGVAERDRLFLTITKDISDTGVSVFTPKQLPLDTELAVSFLVQVEDSSTLPFFRAHIVREVDWPPFYEYGISIQEYLNQEHGPETLALSEILNGRPESVG